METTSINLGLWRLPLAFGASVSLALALTSIGASLWLGVCVGALAGLRLASPLLHPRRHD